MSPAARLTHIKEYYFSKKLKEVARLKAAGKPIINIGIGSPDLDPPKAVSDALQKAIVVPGAHQYQSYIGLPELREGIAHFYKSNYGVQLSMTNEILPLMGSKEGIMHISMAFLNPGDEVLIPDPGYPTYTSVTHLVQGIPKYYTLDRASGWLPDLKKLGQEDLSNVKLMWLNYPHMPTGAKATEAFFKEVVAFAKAHQIMLVNDNPYSFIGAESPKSLLEVNDAKDVAIELNSLSKTFNMAGWRVGMAVGNRELLAQILKVKSNMDSGMFYGIQQGAIAALHLDKDWFKKLNIQYEKRRRKIWELVSALGCTYEKDTAGLFVWAKLPLGISAEAFIDEILYDKHIFITPGTVFGSQGEGYIRLSLCVSEEKINEAIARVQ